MPQSGDLARMVSRTSNADNAHIKSRACRMPRRRHWLGCQEVTATRSPRKLLPGWLFGSCSANTIGRLTV